VRKSTASATNRYLWEGDDLLAQLDTLGNLVAGYTYYQGIDNVATELRRDRADSSYYYLGDYSRNVLALLAHTAAGNTIDNQYRYEPFGGVQGTNPSSVPNAMQFAGREYDAETQLYYDRARYVDPALGRFVSEDPIGLAGGMNLYAFVGNDPVNGWDPTGTKCSDWKLSNQNWTFKGEHLAIGAGTVGLSMLFGWHRWAATEYTALLGLLHEGPWGRMNGSVSLTNVGNGGFGDHDLWGWQHGAKGAPCTGFFDTFTFMLFPLLYDALAWNSLPHGSIIDTWPKAQRPEDVVGSPPPGWYPMHPMIPFPNVLPPGRMPGPFGWFPSY
jgi:RHS repeat-associated protein